MVTMRRYVTSAVEILFYCVFYVAGLDRRVRRFQEKEDDGSFHGVGK